MDNNNFNFELHQQSMKERVKEINQNIIKQVVYMSRINSPTIIQAMDCLETTISNCGGESRIQFREVTSNMIKAYTRVNMEALLFPFYKESEQENPRFCTQVTKLLMSVPWVTGVKWYPGEDRGSYIVLTIKGGKTSEN